MHMSFRALAAIPMVVAALAAPAYAEAPMIGIAFGGGLVGPPASPSGVLNTNLQWNSGLYFRTAPLGSFSEASIGLLSRSQALGINHDEVFETSGLALSIGAKAGPIHLGLDGEFSLLHQILLDPATPGTLMFHNGAGIVIEPYVGVTLPFLKSDFTALDLSFHYPIFKLLDDSIGPRVMATLWVGSPPKKATDDESDQDDDSETAPMPDSVPKSGGGKDGGPKSKDGATVVEPEPEPGNAKPKPKPHLPTGNKKP